MSRNGYVSQSFGKEREWNGMYRTESVTWIVKDFSVVIILGREKTDVEMSFLCLLLDGRILYLINDLVKLHRTSSWSMCKSDFSPMIARIVVDANG